MLIASIEESLMNSTLLVELIKMTCIKIIYIERHIQMETLINKSGDFRGMHNKQRRGSSHPQSKGWILFKFDDNLGYFPSLSEVGKEIGKSASYMWQLYKGKHINVDGSVRTQTIEGYHIKPAISISFTDK